MMNSEHDKHGSMVGLRISGTICSISTCQSNRSLSKLKGENVVFHRFPKEPSILREWIRRCCRKDAWNPGNSRICSKHFRMDDYDDVIKAQLMGCHPVKLKVDAIPTLFINPNNCQTSISKVVRGKRKEILLEEENLIENPQSCPSINFTCELPIMIKKKENTGESQQPMPLLNCTSKLPLTIKEEEIPAYENAGESQQSTQSVNYINEQPSMITIGDEIPAYENRGESQQSTPETLNINNFEYLIKETVQLKHEIQARDEIISTLTKQIHELEKLIKKKDQSFSQRSKEVFQNFLTPNQVDIAMGVKKYARWAQEDLSSAFTIRYLSFRCYNYLRNSLKYPLPGNSTLKRWASNINMRSGVLKDVLNVMASVGKTKERHEKYTVLCFDEMKVRSTYKYDSKVDEVVGPYSYMQVVMARGLFSNWKQPVFIEFDTKMTKEILLDLIKKLHYIEYEVVSCVSDCGGANQGLWRELNVDFNNTTFTNPLNNNPIFVFADVPHLLKLLRNWLIDQGFQLRDGSIINANPLRALLMEAGSEINSLHKLTPLHINCSGTQRQNVRLAAQLFSRTVGTALLRYQPGKDTKEASDLGNFVKLVDSWFDIMNSYTISAGKPSKQPYGVDMESQNKILDTFKTTVQEMRCFKKSSKETDLNTTFKNLQIFQKGIIMSTNSLKGLLAHITGTLSTPGAPLHYILTHRLNQDVLENFFSQLRTRGGLNDHPSPMECLYRTRVIMLGKNPGMVQSHPNVEWEKVCPPQDGDIQFIMSSALRKADIICDIPEDTNPPELEESTIQPNSLLPSFSSPTTSSPSTFPSTEQDGLEYVAGYLARKHSVRYPELGQYTYLNEKLSPIGMHTYCMPTWVQSLSYGGLTEPSKDWMAKVRQMEHWYLKFNGQNFKGGPKLIKRTSEFVMNVMEPTVPEELVHSFCRVRTFIRIKYLNKTKGFRKTADGPAKKMRKVLT